MNDERLGCDVFPTVLYLRSCPVRLILGNNETRAWRNIKRKYEQIVVGNRRETTQGGISAVTDIALQRKKQKKREA